jgi:hypothetical protein
VRKDEREILFGRTTRKWTNIQVNVKEIRYESLDWIRLAQNKVQYWGLVNLKSEVHPRRGQEDPEAKQLYSFFIFEARWGWLVKATPRTLYRRERDPTPSLQEDGWWTQDRSGRVRKSSPHRHAIPIQQWLIMPTTLSRPLVGPLEQGSGTSRVS